MQPGPTIIYECTTCGNKLSRGSFLSGNTFGAKTYSDGKIKSRMMPDIPDMTICERCSSLLWTSKLKQSRLFHDEDDYDNLSKGDFARFLNIYEYFSALGYNIYSSTDEEVTIRTRILWGFNDRIRDNKQIFINTNDQKLYTDNIIGLLELLDIYDPSEKLMIAELNRNLGNFKNCIEIIQSINEPRIDSIKAAYVRECDAKNVYVFLLRE